MASATAQGSGQGLGLVADAMSRHSGRVEFGNQPGGGALVRLVLPVTSRTRSSTEGAFCGVEPDETAGVGDQGAVTT
jgi:nitrogen-specific signal transduction histidine kinase